MKRPRPEVLGGITIKVKTTCGNMYVQMNWCEGKLFEIFATLGKAGGCATCQSEAITRSITLGLRCGIPVDEYINQLRGIRCPNPMPFPKENAIMSCPDALSKALTKYGGLTIEEVIGILQKANGTAGEVDESKEEHEAAERTQELVRIREEMGL